MYLSFVQKHHFDIFFLKNCKNKFKKNGLVLSMLEVLLEDSAPYRKSRSETESDPLDNILQDLQQMKKDKKKESKMKGGKKIKISGDQIDVFILPRFYCVQEKGVT